MNVAVPPFDDLFIRRAVGLAFDTKTALAAVHAGDPLRPVGTAQGTRPFTCARRSGGRSIDDFDPFQGKQGPDRRARADTAIGKSSYQHHKDGDCIDPCAEGSRSIGARHSLPGHRRSLDGGT